MYSGGGQSVLELDSSTATTINTWSHIVCTVSVNAAAMYINGALVGNATRNGEPGIAADPLTFGHAGYHGFFPGQLDDIRIYDRALSMSEIVYLAGGQGPPAAPTGAEAVFSGNPQKPYIDLTWVANTEADLAGYNVYRHRAGEAPVRINSELVPTPSFRDTQVAVGNEYFYSVSAVDLRQNESARSPETSETVPTE